MSDYNRRALPPDNDPLLRGTSLLLPPSHHTHNSSNTANSDDVDSQSADYNDDNYQLRNTYDYEIEDNFNDIETNFDIGNIDLIHDNHRNLRDDIIDDDDVLNIDSYRKLTQNQASVSTAATTSTSLTNKNTPSSSRLRRYQNLPTAKNTSLKLSTQSPINILKNNRNYYQQQQQQQQQQQSIIKKNIVKQIKFSDEQNILNEKQASNGSYSPTLNNNPTHHNTGYSYVSGDSDIWSKILIIISYIFLVISFPFSLCACIKVAQEYERAVVFRLGRIIDGGHKGPGIFFVLPCVDTYMKVDLRTVTFDVPPQEILTKDSVTVSVDAVVYFRIFNAVISVINVEDAAKSTKLLAASTLRNVLGTKSLHEILSDRETVASLIQTTLLAATSPWGVQVERVEVKDVRLPVQLQRAMATEAEAAREARAKVIAAEGEKKASVALKEAACVINQSPIAIQLRYLQTLTAIASEKNSTIVFPIPLELISNFSKGRLIPSQQVNINKNTNMNRQNSITPNTTSTTTTSTNTNTNTQVISTLTNNTQQPISISVSNTKNETTIVPNTHD